MTPLALLRVLGVTAAGSLILLLAVTLAYWRQAGFTLEMDRDLPPFATGFYPVERAGDLTFAWTRERAVIHLRGATRDVPWVCGLVVRGGRAAPLPQPLVEVAVDDVTLRSELATNDFRELVVETPPRPGRPGLRLGLTATPTFVPGPGDPRALGVQVDRIWCRPGEGARAQAPGAARIAAAVTGGALALAFLLVGSAGTTVAGTSVAALPLAVAFARDAAPYTAYPGRIAWLTAWILLALVVTVEALRRVSRVPLSPHARFVMAFSAAALIVELAGLLHPAKPLVDALFHAHRLEWVLDGRYLFTQPMPDGVRFPYAIGLYVVAAPWTWLTADLVTLLRVVVLASHALAAALLYPLVVRAWDDRLAAVLAVVFVHLAPLPLVVIGNANLTFAFGQSVATAVIVAVATCRLGPRHVVTGLLVTGLAALAFLSHVGVFPVLLAALLATALLFRLAGPASLRAAAVAVVVATVLASAFSVVTYYGRFEEAYRSLDRVVSRALSVGRSAQDPVAVDGERAPEAPTRAPGGRSPGMRLLSGLQRLVAAVGLPVFLLALAGAARLLTAGPRHRVALTFGGVTLAYAAFLASTALTPVEPRFERYADEFFDRLAYLALPVVAVLAGRGASWIWPAGRGARIVVLALAGLASATAVRTWLAWLE